MDAQPSVGDLTGKEHHFAKYVADGIDLCGDGERAGGVIQEGKDIGRHSTIATGNQLKVVASAALARGTSVTSNADSQAKAAGDGDEVNGVVIEPSSAAGEMCLIEFNPTGALPE
ncbi:MAG: hypothetical protein ACJ8DZ_14080 [Allosphingosinicella sp.]